MRPVRTEAAQQRLEECALQGPASRRQHQWAAWGEREGLERNPYCLAQALMASVERCPAAGLGALRAEVADLRKYAALNYVAVIKAVKKRNRHLGAAVGSRQLRPLRALELLSAQHFYTSPRLAALATQAELLSQARARTAPPTPKATSPVAACLDAGISRLSAAVTTRACTLPNRIMACVRAAHCIRCTGCSLLPVAEGGAGCERALRRPIHGIVKVRAPAGCAAGAGRAGGAGCGGRAARRVRLPHLPGPAAQPGRAHLRAPLLLGLPARALRDRAAHPQCATHPPEQRVL